MSESQPKKASKPAQPTKRPIFELKNGKVIFKQKPYSFEKETETLQEIVKFREMLEERINKQDPPLATVPNDYQPVIVKLAHESDKTPSVLAKIIQQELLPAHDDDDDSEETDKIKAALPLSVVERQINLTMTRNNYGLAPSGYKPSPSLCVWRWEVNDEFRDWLPKAGREKADARLAERIQANKDLQALFDSLPQDQREAMIGSKGTTKLPAKDATKPDPSTDQDTKGKADPKEGSSISVNLVSKSNEIENVQSGDTTPKARSRKAIDSEKAAKVKERQDRHAAKTQKEKKDQEAQNKSRSLMANYFNKPKTVVSKSTSKEANAFAGPSTSESEFQRTFKPFVLKKDTELAPINSFIDAQKKKPTRADIVRDYGDVIVIEDDDSQNLQSVAVHSEPVDVSQLTAQERLCSILRCMMPSRHRSLPSSLNFKNYHSTNTRDIVSALNEAEIAGDPAQVRSLLSILRNRRMLPAKVLVFHEDARPGYFGTWTRNSKVIGPRTPLARDMLAFDYGYDSGEDWEEEAPGDADDVVDDGEEEGDGEDADSDLESWLVDDDAIEDIGTPDEVLDLSPMSVDMSMLPPKRKPEAIEMKMGKKRKVVVPLVPYAKGPYWESTIGQSDYEPFRPYRIQLFNDTPFPIDPFTFVSSSMETQRTTTSQKQEATFAVPPLPGHVLASAAGIGTSKQTTAVSVAKRTASVPTHKMTFPETHIPFLLSKISSLATGNITFLVESVFQELREHKVKKYAIEAKVKEFGEKSKEKKIWVVKEDIKALYGTAPS